jgi:hypothetical protein
MPTLRPIVLALSLSAVPLAAQVTGVPGINDYTINGLVSGSTSCTPICIPGPATLTLSVSTAVGNAACIVFNTCPCTPCAFPWPTNACVPAIPPALSPPCSGATNQSIDMLLGGNCLIAFSAFVFANTAGIASLTITVPGFSTGPCTAVFSTQAVVFDFCGAGGPPIGPGPFVTTQGYSIAF